MEIPKQKRMLLPMRAPLLRETVPAHSAFSRSLPSLVERVVGKLYRLFLGWLDRPLAKQHEKRFREEIRNQLRFLFDDHAARVIANDGCPFPPSFDGAYVTIAVEPLLLRFIRGRGDFSVNVASSFAPKQWLDFQLVADGIAQWSLSEPRPHPYSLEEFASMLRPRLDQLLEGLSEQRYEATLQNAIYLHNNAIDHYAAEAKEAGFEPTVF
jgi:hypothetical protein